VYVGCVCVCVCVFQSYIVREENKSEHCKQN